MHRRERNSGSLVLHRGSDSRRRSVEILMAERQHHRLAPCSVEKASRNPARDRGQAFSFRRDGGTESARRHAANGCRPAAQNHSVPARHRRLQEAHTTAAGDGRSQPRQRSLETGQHTLQRDDGARLPAAIRRWAGWSLQSARPVAAIRRLSPAATPNRRIRVTLATLLRSYVQVS